LKNKLNTNQRFQFMRQRNNFLLCFALSLLVFHHPSLSDVRPESQ
jgi:hypothetical protein